jgi:hypothetical protein
VIDTYTSIKNIVEGESYEQIFMISDAKSFTPKGKPPFVRFKVQDVTGIMPGVVWGLHLRPHGSSMSAGRFVRMKADVTTYNGEKQLNVQKEGVQPFRGEPTNIQDYVYCPSSSEIKFYSDEIRRFIEDMEDPDYRDVLRIAEEQLELTDVMLATSPYGLYGPLACRGGLLIHTAHIIRAAKACVSIFGEVDAEINESLLVAGCLLRNIGWHTTTYFEGNILKPIDAHEMTGLYRASFRMVHDILLHADSQDNINVPEAKKQALENICNPFSEIKTLEGKIIAHVCNLADTIHFGDYCLRRNRDSTNWADGFFTGHNNA